MKAALSILFLAATLTFAAFAQAPAASSTNAASSSDVIPVTPPQADAIASAQANYKAAQVAEAAPVRALLASPEQQALHASTTAALNQLKAALDMAAGSVDTSRMQYNPTLKAWTRAQNGSRGSGGLPIAQ